MVLGRDAGTRIDHKNNHIGFSDSLLGLFGHLFVDAFIRVGFKPARVNHDVLISTLPALSIMPVAGQPSEICHDGISAFGQSIE